MTKIKQEKLHLLFKHNLEQLVALEKTLATSKSLKEKQVEVEDYLKIKDDPNILPALPNIDDQDINESKAYLQKEATKVLSKTKVSPEMKFITPPLLTALTIDILFKLLAKTYPREQKIAISQTSLVRAISQHFIRQITWREYIATLQDKPNDELYIDALKKNLSEDKEGSNRKAKTLAAKMVDLLPHAGIAVLCNKKKRKPGTTTAIRSTLDVSLSEKWSAILVRTRYSKSLIPMLCPPNP